MYWSVRNCSSGIMKEMTKVSSTIKELVENVIMNDMKLCHLRA